MKRDPMLPPDGTQISGVKKEHEEDEEERSQRCPLVQIAHGEKNV